MASVACLALGASHLQGQLSDVSAYYFNLASASGSSPVSDAGVSNFQRLRVMWAPELGPLALDVAYEHALTLHSTDVLGTGSGILVPEAIVRRAPIIRPSLTSGTNGSRRPLASYVKPSACSLAITGGITVLSKLVVAHTANATPTRRGPLVTTHPPGVRLPPHPLQKKRSAPV